MIATSFSYGTHLWIVCMFLAAVLPPIATSWWRSRWQFSVKAMLIAVTAAAITLFLLGPDLRHFNSAVLTHVFAFRDRPGYWLLVGALPVFLILAVSCLVTWLFARFKSNVDQQQRS